MALAVVVFVAFDALTKIRLLLLPLSIMIVPAQFVAKPLKVPLVGLLAMQQAEMLLKWHLCASAFHNGELFGAFRSGGGIQSKDVWEFNFDLVLPAQVDLGGVMSETHNRRGQPWDRIVVVCNSVILAELVL